MRSRRQPAEIRDENVTVQVQLRLVEQDPAAGAAAVEGSVELCP